MNKNGISFGKEYKHYFCLVLILLIGSAVRIYHLDFESIWLDEAISINYRANEPILKLFQSTITSDVHPPLYYIFLHYWLILGKSTFMIRLLSADIGIVSIIIFYFLARQFYSERVALVAGALLALSPYHLWYSQEARMYILQLLFILCMSYYFFQVMRSCTIPKKDWILYILFCIAGLYTHYFTGVILVSHAIAILFLFLRDRESMRLKIITWFFSQIIIGLLFFPWLYVARQQAFVKNTSWIPPLTFKTVYETPLHFLLGANIVFPLVATEISILVFAVVLIQVVWNYEKVAVWFKDYYLGNMITLTWLIVPIVMFILMSFHKSIYAVDRYLIICLPAFYLLLSSWLEYFFVKRMKYALIGILFIAMSISLVSYYTQLKKIPFFIPARIIQKEEESGDALVFLPAWQYPGFQHYFRGAEPGYFSNKMTSYFYPAQVYKMWRISTQHPRRIWFLTVGGDVPEVASFLGSHYQQKLVCWQIRSPLFESVDLVLYKELVEGSE